ncbi:MAG: beta-N-acetylhexosaminidase, partial [Tannerella sp.]|nr:beta-N-acetylhexosaminidase [Tannerella sp.]
ATVNAQQINLIPEPVAVTATTGTFSLNEEVAVVAAKNLQPQADFLKEMLLKEANIIISVGKTSKNKRIIKLEINGKLQLPEEGYSLSVTPQAVTVSAPNVKGIFYGIQSLRQLITETGEIPCVEIEDWPRFGWRGLMLDVSRTFLPVNLLKRYIDLMALYKLNTLHWHLTDDQGWRIEIKKYPLLTEVGSKFSPQANRMGGYYSQEDVKDIIRYASERNITIIPEIEMPGHSLETLISYPQFACTGTDMEKLIKRGIIPCCDDHTALEALCAGNEDVFLFLDGVIAEVSALFPSKYFHVGGDEVPKGPWKTCSKCQKIIADNHLADENALQGYFMQRVQKILEKYGKTMVGWDEILLESQLPEDIVGMCWRSREYVKKLSNEGHKVIATPTDPLYFDYNYKSNSSRNVYEYNPAENLSSEAASNLLGMQANFWSHIDCSEIRIDRQLFPRLIALAAAAWTPVTQKDWQQFQPKLEAHYKRLEQMHVDYYKPEP